MRTQVRLLPDGRRLHLHDGPIDLIVEAFGSTSALHAAYEAAEKRFVQVLDELCEELAILRSPNADAPHPQGPIAERMVAAVAPYRERIFITPMAAVAGAVAEEILDAMTSAAALSRAYVNNGGDIAIHLAPGASLVVGLVVGIVEGMVARPDHPSLFGTTTLTASHPVRGIATSGWRGRSFSLGIADAVTVLAESAAMADAAATVIANAIDLPGHPGITRIRACDLAPDSDLGALEVTQGVGRLTVSEIHAALDAGEAASQVLVADGLIHSAALRLADETRVVGKSPELGTICLPQTKQSTRSPLHA